MYYIITYNHYICIHAGVLVYIGGWYFYFIFYRLSVPAAIVVFRTKLKNLDDEKPNTRHYYTTAGPSSAVLIYAYYTIMLTSILYHIRVVYRVQWRI